LRNVKVDLNLVGILTDLFLAGGDTAGNTTNFGIRYLVQNPRVQAKMQQEIDEVLGNRWITLNDQPKLDTVLPYSAFKVGILIFIDFIKFSSFNRLKYTEAFIQELLRYSTFETRHSQNE